MCNSSYFLTAFTISLGTYCAIWLVCYMIYRLRKLHLYQGFYPHKIISGSELLTKSELLHEIKQLYLQGIIQNLYLGEDYISFEDKGYLWTWNIYYLKFSKLDELHYRGAFRVYQYQKKNLETMRAYLSKVG